MASQPVYNSATETKCSILFFLFNLVCGSSTTCQCKESFETAIHRRHQSLNMLMTHLDVKRDPCALTKRWRIMCPWVQLWSNILWQCYLVICVSVFSFNRTITYDILEQQQQQKKEEKGLSNYNLNFELSYVFNVSA